MVNDFTSMLGYKFMFIVCSFEVTFMLLPVNTSKWSPAYADWTLNSHTVYMVCIFVVLCYPLILIRMTPLCHGGILRIDLTVPIVAFGSQVFV